jgi:hypothetical protein
MLSRAARAIFGGMKAKPSHAALSLALLLLAFPPALAPAEEGGGDEAMYAELFGESLPEEGPEDTLRIAAIEAETPPCFTEAYVKSFLRGVRAGDSLTRRELESALAMAARRMELSGMFYQAKASYAPCGTDSEAGAAPEAGAAIEVKAILSVSEGFWWGFNFSPWDLSLGYANLSGEGKILNGAVGLNTQRLRYADPAIKNGRASASIEAGHVTAMRGSGADPSYLTDSFSANASAGYLPEDDLMVRAGAGYLAIRPLGAYFLYPDYLAPDQAGLSALGLSPGFRHIPSVDAVISAGSFSYRERGGVKARAEGRAVAYLPIYDGAWLEPEPAFKVSFSGDLRFDAPELLRLTLSQTAEYCPSGTSGVPEPLWARPGAFRSDMETASGEFASLSRASLALDALWSPNLGFTTMSLVPEVYYEAALVRRASRSDAFILSQDCGFLVKAAFSVPVGRTFGFGCALALPVEDEPKLRFILEIE